ncbi:MAG TPA: methyltransferase [Nitrososphaera sp.]|nr:methyltransferase [Nitrososphaera sp.]
MSSSSSSSTSSSSSLLPTPHLEHLSPDPIFQMLTGFFVSRALMAAVELNLFTKLSGGKQVNAQELQEMLGMERRPVEVFATTLASLGLLQKKEDKFSSSPLADAFLSRKSPAYMGGIIEMFDKRLYNSWSLLTWSLANNKPVDAINGGGAESLFDDAKKNESMEAIKKFTHAMHALSVGPAMALARAFDFTKCKRMLDVGGGSGVYALQVAKEYPQMQATVADLAPVCEVADEYISRYGLAGRVRTHAIDFFKDDLPKEYDVVFLSNVIHDYDEDKCIALLKKAYASISDERGGAVIISEWMLNDDKTGPVPSALMGLNMMIETNGGRNYSFAEVSSMLAKAGFKKMEKRPLAGPAEIAIGYKE